MDRVREALYLPEDPARIGVDGSGVRIAVIDTGIDASHPDLVDSVSVAQSRVFGLGGSIDDHVGHGTHVAGIIAGSGAASEGRYRGIAPGAELIALKALADGRGYTDDVAAAIFHAIELGVDIINYSASHSPWRIAGGGPPWKWSTHLTVRDEAFQAAVEAGILCVGAAGNDGPHEGSINSPGILSELLTCGALTESGEELASISSRGPAYLDDSLAPNQVVSRVDIFDTDLRTRKKPNLVAPGAAPGMHSGSIANRFLGPGHVPLGPVSARSRDAKYLRCVEPSDPDCLYARMGGTSQATAVVTGLAALVLQLGREWNIPWERPQGEVLRKLLEAAAVQMTAYSPDEVGNGRLLWPTLLGNIEDYRDSDVRRANILDGPQLRLEGEAEPDA